MGESKFTCLVTWQIGFFCPCGLPRNPSRFLLYAHEELTGDCYLCVSIDSDAILTEDFNSIDQSYAHLKFYHSVSGAPGLATAEITTWSRRFFLCFFCFRELSLSDAWHLSMARHLWKGICLNSRLFARQDQTISRICHSSRSSRSLQTGALQRRILLWTGGVFLGSAALTSAPLVVMAATTADEAAKVIHSGLGMISSTIHEADWLIETGLNGVWVWGY